MMTEVVSNLGTLMITAMPAHMSMGRHLSHTSVSFVRIALKEKNREKKKCKKGLTTAGNIEGIFIFVPNFEVLIADEALLDGNFGATNRESARRALS
jgi:hypothetical protein